MLNRKSQRNVTEAELEFVTMDTLKEMLDQQKTIYEEVLKGRRRHLGASHK
uniref:Uncharacterized protein n=1 Tax=Anguilla anguilla TaxID=7936 RepID=A0A0E9SS69_ANGAN